MIFVICVISVGRRQILRFPGAYTVTGACHHVPHGHARAASPQSQQRTSLPAPGNMLPTSFREVVMVSGTRLRAW